MSVSNRHLLSQGAGLRAVARAAVSGVSAALLPSSAADPLLPGPLLRSTSAPLPRELLRDYIVHVGGDPEAYADRVPHHLFPQWTFGLAGGTLSGTGYPLVRVVNGGCRLICATPIPAGMPLESSARLERVDDNGRRVVLQQRITSGPAAAPESLVAELYAIVPLPGAQGAKERSGASADSRPSVPVDARELALWNLESTAGLDFAKLTGDFNPIHWWPLYARASGFQSVILHGFATMARTFEGLVGTLCAGKVDRLRELDVRFTRPLVLPARVGLYVHGDSVFVGDAPGGPTYLAGRFVLEP